MRNLFLLLMLCAGLSVNGLSQCGLSGPGTNGSYVNCGQNVTYSASCASGPVVYWTIGAGTDIQVGGSGPTSLPVTFTESGGSGPVGGTVVAASLSSITINWSCETCGDDVELHQSGIDFFNPIIRITGNVECGIGPCIETSLVDETFGRCGRGSNIGYCACFTSDCGACIEFFIHLENNIFFFNQPLRIAPGETVCVKYSTPIVSVWIQNWTSYSEDCESIDTDQTTHDQPIIDTDPDDNGLPGDPTGPIKGRSDISDSNLQLVQAVTISPNPVSVTAHIEVYDGLMVDDFKIYNINGQVQYDHHNQDDHNIDVDVGTWAIGIYIVVLQYSGGIITKKLLVK